MNNNNKKEEIKEIKEIERKEEKELQIKEQQENERKEQEIEQLQFKEQQIKEQEQYKQLQYNEDEQQYEQHDNSKLNTLALITLQNSFYNINFQDYQIVVEQAPEKFYKDKRGKDNFISLKVSLKNIHNDQKIPDEIIRKFNLTLKLSLYYDNNYDFIIKQDIFKVLNTNKLRIIENGETEINFRIEQVSRVHQHHKFCVKIEVDKNKSSTNYSHIVPIFTSAIEVLSKQPRTLLATSIQNNNNINNNNNNNNDNFENITGKKRSLESVSSDEEQEEKSVEEISQKNRKLDDTSSSNASISEDELDEFTIRVNEFIFNEVEKFKIMLSKRVPTLIRNLRKNNIPEQN